jgi:DNA polymerase-3 subunit chi
MPRADFYLISSPRYMADPLRVVCVLAKRLFETDAPALILAADLSQAEDLDQRLWAFQPDAFVPHQIAGREAGDEHCPILIVPPGTAVAARAQLINLRESAVEGEVERVLEVVPPQEAARVPLRARWKDYKARGFELLSHTL